MKISDLPHFSRFQSGSKVKVLRHADSNLDLWDLRRTRKFSAYQDKQGWDAFGDAQYVLSFIAESGRFARFVSVWEVLSKSQNKNKGFRYKTRELDGFLDLERRLVVDWGPGTRSWAQWFNRRGDKEIIEISPRHRVRDFPGYYSVTLPFGDLQEIVKHPDSNRDWRRMLSSVGGVYVILDQVSGLQYIGSAYGKNGIWARWTSYAKNPTGGNALLKELLGKHPGRQKAFQFSILRVLEPGASKEEVIGQEKITKDKLGSRAFGLNLN